MADAPLHVGIDGRELIGHVTGVGRYVGEVVRVWAATSRFRRLTAFVHAAPDAAVRDRLGAAVEWHVVPARLGGTWWEQRRLPRALGTAGVDVLFAGGYTAPLVSPCPFVAAVHDGSFWAHPEWFGVREGVRRRWLTRQTVLRAAHVITISQFSAHEVRRFTNLAADRITVASPGAPEPPRTVLESAGDRRRSDRPAPMVLYVGSLFNRRLIPELIAGFARAAAQVPGARLVLVGDNRTRPHVDPIALARAAGIESQVDWRAYVDDATLATLYDRARVFAFLSSYEGFAMTPLEAARHGVPGVLLDTAVAREVYGGAARLVTADPASIAAAFVELLTDDTAHRQLVEAGRSLFDRYQWTSTAETIARTLETAAREHRA